MTEEPLLLPGVATSEIRAALLGAAVELDNIRGSGGTVYDRWGPYLRTTTNLTTRLAFVFRPDAIEDLLFGPRYRQLLALMPVLAPAGHQSPASISAAGDLLDGELSRLSTTLTAIATSVGASRQSLSGRRELMLVPDTNVLTSRPGRPDDENLSTVPWLRLLDATIPLEPPALIRIQLPLLVIDELDVQKDRGKPDARQAARRMLRHLNGLLASRHQDRPFTLDPGGRPDGLPAVILELVFDAAGHQRLPRPDDELVRVARNLHTVRGETVHLVTCDFHCATRARRFENRFVDGTELLVHLVSGSYDDPPAIPLSRRQQRRDPDNRDAPGNP